MGEFGLLLKLIKGEKLTIHDVDASSKLSRTLAYSTQGHHAVASH